MVQNKVTGQCQLDRLYQQAKKKVPRAVLLSADPHIEASYISWKRKVHVEFYRLIKEAGIYIEGA